MTETVRRSTKCLLSTAFAPTSRKAPRRRMDRRRILFTNQPITFDMWAPRTMPVRRVMATKAGS